MTRQAKAHTSPGIRKAVLLLRKGGKHTPAEICGLTGVPERTQRNWVTGAKASGDWNLMSVKLPPRKRRSDAGQGKKLTRRTIAAIKTRLLDNPRLTVAELQGKVPGLSVVTRQWVNYVILHKIGLKSKRDISLTFLRICCFQFVKLCFFNCLFSTLHYLGKYWSFCKKSDSFGNLVIWTIRKWYYMLRLVKFEPFYDWFTYPASYQLLYCTNLSLLTNLLLSPAVIL